MGKRKHNVLLRRTEGSAIGIRRVEPDLGRVPQIEIVTAANRKRNERATGDVNDVAYLSGGSSLGIDTVRIEHHVR